MQSLRSCTGPASSEFLPPAGPALNGDLHYYNWRCATRGSNRFDLMDDMLHVLQATYCDIYATAEAKQSEYASHLLARTRVEIYGRQTPIDRWLETLLPSEGQDLSGRAAVSGFA